MCRDSDRYEGSTRASARSLDAPHPAPVTAVRMGRGRVAVTLALGAILVLAACEDPVTGPAEAVDDHAASEIVEAEWASLVVPEALELETLSALRAQPGGEGAAYLAEAGLLAAEAEDLERTGSTELAREVEGLVDLQWAEAALTALGSATVDRTAGGAEAVLSRLSGVQLDRDRRAAFERAATHVERARAARSAGRPAEAVVEGTRAANEIRGMSPEAHARSVVAAALELLERAQDMAGEDPDDGIAAALARAESHCRAAQVALDRSAWRRAVEEGRSCGRIARAVIVRLGGGTSEADLADRAEQAVAQAQAYLERAVEKAGDDPRPVIAEALERARTYLSDAERALEAGHYREAIRAAQASTAISRRILTALRPGSDDDGSDRPDDIGARAQVAIDAASDGLARAVRLAGSDPSEEIRTALARASGLLDQAVEAFRAGRYRVAIGKAHDSLAISRRVIQALGAEGR